MKSLERSRPIVVGRRAGKRSHGLTPRSAALGGLQELGQVEETADVEGCVLHLVRENTAAPSPCQPSDPDPDADSDAVRDSEADSTPSPSPTPNPSPSPNLTPNPMPVT